MPNKFINEDNMKTAITKLKTYIEPIKTQAALVPSKADIAYVDNRFNGASKAVSFASYSAMITALNGYDNSVYSIGQDIYIVTNEVPDLWVSGVESSSSSYTYVDDATFTAALKTNGYVQVGYYKLSALETQKVDLTNYISLGTETQIFDSSKILNFKSLSHLSLGDTTSARAINFYPKDTLHNNDSIIDFTSANNYHTRLFGNNPNNISVDLLLPQQSGTLALTSDIPDTSNFIDLSTTTQTLAGNKTIKIDDSKAFKIEQSNNSQYYTQFRFNNTNSSYRFNLGSVNDYFSISKNNLWWNGHALYLQNRQGTAALLEDISADNFSISNNYSAGDLTIYSSKLYKCTTDHSAAAWNASHFTEVTVEDLLNEKQDLLTTSNVSDGTVNKVIGFDSSGNLVKGVAEQPKPMSEYKVEDIVNSKLYTTYSITVSSITNGEYVDGNELIPVNGTAVIEILPITGYDADSSTITVTGATLSSYDNQTKKITLSAPTGDVTISIECTPNVMLTSSNELLKTSNGDRILFN